MKTICYVLLLGLLLVSCKNDASTQKTASNIEIPETTPNLEGAWELIGFSNYLDNEVINSIDPTTGYRQVKMYTAAKVMWSKNVPTDSTEWFGYGSYTLKDNTLTEVLDYGSEMMSKIIQEKKEFVYEVNIEGNSFSQIEIDEDGNRIYSENYKRIK